MTWTPEDTPIWLREALDPWTTVNTLPTLPGDRWGWHGHITITIRDLDGFILDVVEFPNLICDVGRGLLRDGLRGAVSDTKIKYLALGTSGTTPATSDTHLGAEAFRKAATSYSTVTNGVVTNTYLAPGDAVGVNIAELGWFAGPTATASANSGVLVAHTLYSHTKTNTESIQIQRTDTFS